MTEHRILPMLAGKTDLSKQKFPVYASPKLDGIRCLIIGGEAVTRKLKPIPNHFVRNVLSETSIGGLDGELIVGDPTDPDAYRKTVSEIMRHGGEPNFTFWVFDRINIGAQIPWKIRMDNASLLASAARDRGLDLREVPYHLCTSLAHILEREEESLSLGYEGLMLRLPDGPYKMGRSTSIEGHLTKLKRFEDSEAYIVSLQELMHNGNEGKTNALGRTERSTHKANKVGLNTLGAMEVRDIYSGIVFSVGTGIGLDDKLRKLIWDSPEEYIGKIIKYRFFPGGSKDKPRFPTFHGFRDPSDL